MAKKDGPRDDGLDRRPPVLVTCVVHVYLDMRTDGEVVLKPRYELENIVDLPRDGDEK